MDNSQQPRVPEGVAGGGQFSEINRPQITTIDTAVTSAEFAAIGFSLADSTAGFCAIATDPAQPMEARRTAARAAIERADDSVISARHQMSDEGDGVTVLATSAADDDDVLDSALGAYIRADYGSGDEHLFGVDLAAVVYEADRESTTNMWMGRYYGASRSEETYDPRDAYESDDPKAMILDDLFDRADLARM